MKKVINGIGFAIAFLGFAGIGGAVDTGKSTSMPILVLIVGCLILGATSLYEVVKDEKKNRNSSSYYMRDDARPFYLR